MEQTFLISSANGGAGESIRLVSVDSKGWHIRQSIDRPQDAAFLAMGSGCLYSVTEADDRAAVHRLPQGFSPSSSLDTLPLPQGRGLCHISLSPKNGLLLGACYESGHLFGVDVRGEQMQLVFAQHQEDLQLPQRLSRAHCFLADPLERYAFAVNIALDQIDSFLLKPGHLEPNRDYGPTKLQKGEGPRHLLFHPTVPMAYCVTEYSSRLLVFSYDAAAGTLTQTASRSLLDDDFSGESFGASIAISADCRYLYASNRGENSVAVFSLAKNGMPLDHKNVPCGGDWPRHIALSRDNSLLAVCNQRSDLVTIFTRSASAGLPGEAVAQIPMKNPCFAVGI